MAMREARKSAKALTKRQKKFLNYCVPRGSSTTKARRAKRKSNLSNSR